MICKMIVIQADGVRSSLDANIYMDPKRGFVEARKHGKQVGNKEELFLELCDEIKVIRVDRELMPHNLSNG